MIDERTLLERAAQKVPPPERVFDGLIARRSRKRRNERIATTLLALILAAAAIGGAIRMFRSTERRIPGAPSITPSNVGRLRLAWSARLPAEYSLDMTLAGDRIYVMSGGRLVVFDPRCGTGGATCSPVWSAPISGSASVWAQYRFTPVVNGGSVYVVGPKDLEVFATDCGSGGATCQPRWTWSLPGEVDLGHGPSLDFVAGSVRLTIHLRSGGWRQYVFPSSCGMTGSSCLPSGVSPPSDSRVEHEGRIYLLSRDGRTISVVRDGCDPQPETCPPIWSWTAPGGAAEGVGWPPIFGDGVMFVTVHDPRAPLPRSTYALSTACRGSVCHPLWTATGWIFGEPSSTLLLLTRTLRGLGAYSTSCASDGSRCAPLFTIPGGKGGFSANLSPDGRMVYAGGISGPPALGAYSTTCATDGSACSPTWTFRPLGDWLGFMQPTDGLVFVSASYTGSPLFAYSEHCGSGGTECAPLWSSENVVGPVHVRSPIIQEDRIYFTGPHTIYALSVGAAPVETGGATSKRPALIYGAVFFAVVVLVLVRSLRRRRSRAT